MKKAVLVFTLLAGFTSASFAQEKIKEKNGVVKTKNETGKIKENKMTGEVKKKDGNGVVTKTKLDLGKVTADKVKPTEKTTKVKTAETKTKKTETIAPAKKEGATGIHNAVNKKVKKDPVPSKK